MLYWDLYIEDWRDVREFHGAYEVSSFGRVRQAIQVVRHAGKTYRTDQKLLKPALVDGYEVVTLRDGKEYLVHHLVAKAFLINWDLHSSVAHKNGKITDNRAVNLQWTSEAEEIESAVKTRNKFVLKKSRKKYVKSKRYRGCTAAKIIGSEFESELTSWVENNSEITNAELIQRLREEKNVKVSYPTVALWRLKRFEKVQNVR